ncbi:MAG: multi-copper polyphenol oxidoreductase [Gammaproteobacteria bacterium]|nr:MAG: multi-copper polyphenol oxidoreductase [Gammaproteobacteria bacterium]
MPVVLTPEWREPPPGLTVLSTTRHGGVSEPPWDSMNLGRHTGDDADAVQANRARLVDAFHLPAEPRWLRQVHGTAVAVFSNGAGGGEEADAAYTDQPGIVIAVLTADCLPVVIASADGTAVAVVHAGWRGLADGILDEVLGHFDGRGPLKAWLAPAIGPDAFEVGPEVRAAFVRRDTSLDAAFRQKPNADGAEKYLGDLYAITRADLSRLGVDDVVGGQHCTFTEAEDFHSYRRDGARSGRMATLAWIALQSGESGTSD